MQEEKSNKLKSLLLFLAVASWMLIIFLFSAETGDSSAGKSTAIANFLIELGVALPLETLSCTVRKVTHFGVYFVLGFLTYLFFASLIVKGKQLNNRTIFWASFTTVSLYALSDEIHQLFIPDRSGQLTDVLIDTLGGTTAILMVFLIKTKRTKRRHKN